MKIKLLSLTLLTVGLLSCGGTKDSASEETTFENKSDMGLVSYVHGVMFSRQLKNQRLPFINPDDLIKDFAEYKKNGLGSFNAEDAINELRNLAQKTDNFASIEGADLDKAKSIFSQLYFDDIKQSPIANEMNFDKFEEGMVTFWKDGKSPSKDSITIFTNYMRNAVIKVGDTFLSENSKNEGVQCQAEVDCRIAKCESGECVVEPDYDVEHVAHERTSRRSSVDAPALWLLTAPNL